MDSAVHRINHYPADNSIGFASVYPLDSDLSGGQRYPSFEQLGPVKQRLHKFRRILRQGVHYCWVTVELSFNSIQLQSCSTSGRCLAAYILAELNVKS